MLHRNLLFGLLLLRFSITHGQKIAMPLFSPKYFQKIMKKEMVEDLISLSFQQEFDTGKKNDSIDIEMFIEIGLVTDKRGNLDSIVFLNRNSYDPLSISICEKTISQFLRKKQAAYPKNKILIFRWFLFIKPPWDEKYTIRLLKENKSFDQVKLKATFDYRDLILIKDVESKSNAILFPIDIFTPHSLITGPGSEVSCN